MALTQKRRPLPPIEFLEVDEIKFAPAVDLTDWARTAFITDDASLRNDDHAHLNQATNGALWTNVPNGRAGRSIIGQAERGLPAGGKWLRARIERQILDWFGDVADFILTFDAHYASQCSDTEFCALVEHELYHCGQERDMFGQPKFRRSGFLNATAPLQGGLNSFIGCDINGIALVTNGQVILST